MYKISDFAFKEMNGGSGAGMGRSVSLVPDHLVPLFLNSLRGPAAVAGAVAAMPQSRNIANLDTHATEQKASDTSGAPPLSLLSRAAALHGRGRFHSTLPAPDAETAINCMQLFRSKSVAVCAAA